MNKQRAFQKREIAFMRNYSRLINSMPICYMKQHILYKNGHAVDYEILEVNSEFEQLFGGKDVFVGKKGTEVYLDRLPHYLQACSFIFTQNKKINTQYYFEPTGHH